MLMLGIKWLKVFLRFFSMSKQIQTTLMENLACSRHPDIGNLGVEICDPSK